jgi:hypothetical protein
MQQQQQQYKLVQQQEKQRQSPPPVHRWGQGLSVDQFVAALQVSSAAEGSISSRQWFGGNYVQQGDSV